jgi:hypothetical protein
MAIYSDTSIQLTIIANKGFITTVAAAISSYLLFILIKSEESAGMYGMGINKTVYRVCAIILLFLSGFIEINHQFMYYYPGTQLNILYLLLYTPVFVYLFNALSERLAPDNYSEGLGLTLFAITIAIYLVLMPVYFDLLADMLDNKKIPTSQFLTHGISAVFIGIIFYKVTRIIRDRFEEGAQKSAAWILSAAIVLFLSLEVCLLSELVFYSKTNTVDLIQTVYIKTGLPVLWGVSSFVLMWIGMRKKLRVLRIISLSLFLITLLKLFLFDINNIPVAGKIAAFFCLGILLLIISFMYQKVKKIIVDDEAKAKNE